MQDSEYHLIFVNETAYCVWSRASSFKTADFLRGFDPSYHLHAAKLLELGLEGENSEQASLGIRTIHGIASEAFLAFLFALLQAPDAPAAWVLLYKVKDLQELIRKLEEGDPIPCRMELPGNSWHDIARTLIPIAVSDFPEAEQIVRRFGAFWAQMATDFRNKSAMSEFNSLKHGLRARPASPHVTIGGHPIPSAEHGSSFPVLDCKKKHVMLSIGCRSWSARSLIAQLELISASFTNLLALLKQLYGIEEFLELEIPGEDVFEAAKPPDSQVFSDMTLTTKWPADIKLEIVDSAKARVIYDQLPSLRVGMHWDLPPNPYEAPGRQGVDGP